MIYEPMLEGWLEWTQRIESLCWGYGDGWDTIEHLKHDSPRWLVGYILRYINNPAPRPEWALSRMLPRRGELIHICRHHIRSGNATLEDLQQYHRIITADKIGA